MTAITPGDRMDIQELTARYAWSLDTGDEDAFVACFCRQGELVWDVFETEGRWRGAQALRRFIAYFRQRPESAGRQHHVSNLVVTPSDSGARARSYVAVAVRRAEGPHFINVMGYYDDELEREVARPSRAGEDHLARTRWAHLLGRANGADRTATRSRPMSSASGT